MPKVKLDAAFCVTAACEPGRRKTDYWDTITPGFVLEARASGGRTYYLRYFDQGGRQRQLKIGGHADVSFDQARKAAKRLRSEVVLGGDPLDAKQEKKTVPTYATLAEQHIDHAKSYQRSWWSVDGIIRKHILPRWGRMRLDEIAPQAVGQWLAELLASGLKPATVEKVRVTFGRSFELARQWGIPGAQTKPVRGVPRPKFDNARNRYLSAAETARLLRAAERSAQPQLRSIIELLLLTGLRKNELLQARWEHVDLERRSWLIPQAKTGARHVPISTAALAILEALPRVPAAPTSFRTSRRGCRFGTSRKAGTRCGVRRACPTCGSTTCGTRRPRS